MIKLIKRFVRFIKSLFQKKFKPEDILEEGEEFDEGNDQYEINTFGAKEV